MQHKTRDELVAEIREGWPEHSKGYYPRRTHYFKAPPVQDGGVTAKMIDYCVDIVLADRDRQPQRIQYNEVIERGRRDRGANEPW